MSLNNDGIVDPDEALRMLDLADGSDSGRDMVLRIDNNGTPVEGEGQRRFFDGKPRIGMRGYQFSALSTTPPGSTKSQVSTTWLCVVRDSDAASASIASLLKNGTETLKVFVQVFKAGGDPSVDEKPLLEIGLTDARVKYHTLLTGGHPFRAMELVVFSYRTLTLSTAPQEESGLAGAVRTCTYVA